MKNWRELLVEKDASLREAMVVIDKGATKTAFVTDCSDILIGVITDGDIRRGLLQNADLETTVSALMNPSPITCSISCSREEVKKKREEIAIQNEAIEEKKKKRDEEREVLGDRGEEQPGIFQRAREGAGNFADEYVPDQIRDVAGAFTEGLTAPFTAIKELGMGFAQMLKPLKLLKPLFTGLVSGLKKFVGGLKASVIAFLPYLAIGALVIGQYG